MRGNLLARVAVRTRMKPILARLTGKYDQKIWMMPKKKTVSERSERNRLAQQV
jgi:hypothetical protein